MKQWPTKLLGEACTVACGGTPSRTRADFYGGGIPWVKISDMLQGTITETEETISTLGLQNSAAKVLPVGTVLISIFATIGRTALLGVEATTNQAIAGVTPKNACEILPTFLRYFLDYSVASLNAKARGVAQLNVNGKILKSLSVPVPPRAQQERIVKRLDEADDLRKMRARADRRSDELIPALFHEMFLSADRCQLRLLHEIASVVSGVAKGRKFNGEKPVTIPYLRVANVQAGYLNLSELKTIEALPQEVEELALKKGDVLLTEGGDFDKLGRGAMLDRDLPNCIHQNHVFRVRCDESQLLPECFANFLLTQDARYYFRRCAKKTSNLASINMTQLCALPVPVPPLILQKTFADRVKEIRAMEAAQAQSRRRLEDLFQSLLHRAFNGDL